MSSGKTASAREHSLCLSPSQALSASLSPLRCACKVARWWPRHDLKKKKQGRRSVCDVCIFFARLPSLFGGEFGRHHAGGKSDPSCFSVSVTDTDAGASGRAVERERERGRRKEEREWRVCGKPSATHAAGEPVEKKTTLETPLWKCA